MLKNTVRLIILSISGSSSVGLRGIKTRTAKVLMIVSGLFFQLNFNEDLLCIYILWCTNIVIDRCDIFLITGSSVFYRTKEDKCDKYAARCLLYKLSTVDLGIVQ